MAYYPPLTPNRFSDPLYEFKTRLQVAAFQLSPGHVRCEALFESDEPTIVGYRISLVCPNTLFIEELSVGPSQETAYLQAIHVLEERVKRLPEPRIKRHKGSDKQGWVKPSHPKYYPPAGILVELAVKGELHYHYGFVGKVSDIPPHQTSALFIGYYHNLTGLFYFPFMEEIIAWRQVTRWPEHLLARGMGSPMKHLIRTYRILPQDIEEL